MEGPVPLQLNILPIVKRRLSLKKTKASNKIKQKKPFKKKERKNTGGTILCFEAHIFHAG